MDSTVLEDISTRLSGPRVHRNTQNEQYVAGNHRPSYAPKEATAEYKSLGRKATVNFVGLVLRSLMQDLSITSYRHKDSAVAEQVWKTWVRGGMPAGKADLAIRHAAVEGVSYGALMPSLRERRWMPGIYSKHDVYVLYDDPVNDPRPTVFAARLPGEPGYAGVWMDKTVGVLNLTTRDIVGWGGTSAQFFGETEPVVRYTAGDWNVGKDGTMAPVGEVGPLIQAQDRVNQAVMDLLLVQTFGAVTLRMLSGLQMPGDDDEARAKKLVLAVDRLLTAEDPDSRLTSAVGTPLEPYIRNVDAAIRHLAIISQTPPNRLLGELENIGADAILVARESQESKLTSYREIVGETHEKFARAMAVADGQPDPGPDGWFTWRSTELRTIAEIFDAVSKAHPVGLNVEPILRRNLQGWRTQEIDELMEGYQTSRQEPSADVMAIVNSVGRQSQELAAVPAAAASSDAGAAPVR